MSKKTQSSKNTYENTQQQADEDITAEAFMKLWQDKWAEMLREKGWSAEFAMPGAGHMPFMMPFMAGFGAPPAPATAPDELLVARIELLEKRIELLEKQNAAAQKTKTPAKPRRKG